ncbi:CHAT domain-containing protein [Mycena latifolia]|nr:CHAT domain-containing protein [Mycena latifolia]
MASLNSILYLDEITVDSLSNPHDDLPLDTQMSAQLIVDRHIFMQTLQVESPPFQLCWDLRTDCIIPSHTHIVLVAIIRHSQSQGTRPLGFVEIRRGEILTNAQYRYYRMDAELIKVNPDGPDLEFKAIFRIFDASRMRTSNNFEIGIPDDQIIPVDYQRIGTRLEQMYVAADNGIPMDFLDLIVMHERILLLSHSGENGNRAHLLNILGDICFQRYHTSQVMEELNQAVCAYADAVRDSPVAATLLGDLGVALRHRFERLGELHDINKSVSVLRDALDFTPESHPHRASRLGDLGNSLLRKFERLGDLQDINQSVSVLQDAVQLTPNDDPQKSSVLGNWGNSLLCRFEQLGDPWDVDMAVSVFREAVSLTPPGNQKMPLRLGNLANSLLCRFEERDDLEDIDQALVMFEQVLELTSNSDSQRQSRLSSLGQSYLSRFERLGEIQDIEKAVLILEDSVEGTPEGHPEKCLRLSNLGKSYLCRFERFGDLGDINKSVSILGHSVRLTPDNHPDKPLRLSYLGNSMLCRFEQLGDLEDINKAIITLEHSVKFTPDGHPHKPSILNNLSHSLFRRFQRSEDKAAVKRCVLIFEDALALTPDGHPGKPLILSNLGNSLRYQFEEFGDLGDLNKSVSMLEDSVNLTPQYHPSKPSRLCNLGNSLLCLFERLGDIHDIDRSVKVLQESADITPNGHPDRPSRLNSLCGSLLCRFELLRDPHDFETMITHYSSAACSPAGPAFIRFEAASLWAKHAQATQHPSLLRAYSVAVSLVPELAWLGLSIPDRHRHLLRAGRVVRDAAAAAIAAVQYEQAVEWLEQGRSVIWSQLLDLRTPIDVLKDSHPDLADRLIFLSIQLEGAGVRDGYAVVTGPIESPQSLVSVGSRYHEYAHERGQLLDQIRTFPGFTSFLLPMKIPQLSLAAREGPVVAINISETRCDALILMPGLGTDIIHIALNCTCQDLQATAESLRRPQGVAGRKGIPEHHDRLFGTQERDDTTRADFFPQLLSDLWFQVAKPILQALAIQTPSQQNLQRIWWCPTGPLTFLPIHAAGLYGEEESLGSKLSDFVISSYAPSLTALIEGFRVNPDSLNGPRLLAVAQPVAEGQSYLPGTTQELNHIEHYAKGKMRVTRLEEDIATIDNVEKGMAESSWVHFACHGLQDSLNPIKSALLLAGQSRLTLSSIIKLSLPQADLAFLSACETAKGAYDLQEESVHLAAGMLLAGYRTVIATMWSIGDNDAVDVAGDVYEHLFKSSPPDSTRAAEALHRAVTNLRESEKKKESKDFAYWVSFIHVGV